MEIINLFVYQFRNNKKITFLQDQKKPKRISSRFLLPTNWIKLINVFFYFYHFSTFFIAILIFSQHLWLVTVWKWCHLHPIWLAKQIVRIFMWLILVSTPRTHTHTHSPFDVVDCHCNPFFFLSSLKTFARSLS